MNQNVKNCYDFPGYYEIAFSFHNISLEVDVIEETIKNFSRQDVRSILELACGPSQHILELSKRGYVFHGLDINESMLTYSKNKADAANISASFHLASMLDFKLGGTR